MDKVSYIDSQKKNLYIVSQIVSVSLGFFYV